jgi:hypothetical protein
MVTSVVVFYCPNPCYNVCNVPMLYLIKPMLCNVIQSDPSLSVPAKCHRFFLMIQTLHWLSVPSNHLDFSVIKYAFNGRGLYLVEWFTYPLLWGYIKTCPTKPLHTAVIHYLFIYTLLTHYSSICLNRSGRAFRLLLDMRLGSPSHEQQPRTSHHRVDACPCIAEW